MKIARYLGLILILILATFIPQMTSAQQSGCSTFHTVQRGENLFSIGLLYNLTWDQLVAANNLANPNYIQAGTVLCIPFGTGGPTTDTPPSTGQVTGSTCRAFHTVRRGEDLRAIGRMYNVTWNILAAANNLADPNYIQTGWVLCVPRTSATGGPTGPTPTTGQVISGQNCRVLHTVRSGENLFRIGLLYGLTWDQLLTANRIINPNYVPAGTIVCIPASPPAPNPQFGTGGPYANVPTGNIITGSPFYRTVAASFNVQASQLTINSSGFPVNSRFDVYVAASPTDFSGGIRFSGLTDANGNLFATFIPTNLSADSIQYVTVVGSEGYWGRAAFTR